MDKLTLPARIADCPNCKQVAELRATAPPSTFAWTDGWLEHRDGSPIPPGWDACPRCANIAARGDWERTGRIGDWNAPKPRTLAPRPEALRAHLETLLSGRLEHDHAQELRLQLWWIANAQRRGADSPRDLDEEERNNLLRLLRPPEAPGFEGGLRRIELLRELGQLEQAKQQIRDVRARLDRLEALVDQGNVAPQLWDPSKPIAWPDPQPRGNLDSM